MEQEDNAYEADDDGFQDQIPLQRLDGFIDQPGAVVASHNFHSRRKRRCNLMQLGFHTTDYVKRIHSETHDHNAANSLPFALPVGSPAAHLRPEIYAAQIA